MDLVLEHTDIQRTNDEAYMQRQIIQAHGQTVYTLVTKLIPCKEDAEEVYQDVFIKAFKNIKSFDKSKASLRTWLCRIAYNESINYLKRKNVPLMYVDDREVDLESLGDEMAAIVMYQQDEQTIRMIEQALQQLPNEEQALITMFYFDDMSIKEIAYVTGSQPSTIGSRLYRIRQKLYHIIKHIQG
ncbi:MAG: sigma-70 family RNA polymerase sigma factor [Bacteroidaceae bacterium]|nr:sigma-70 family RNA polymerase sigma factor [Bacteroidaceae bacterium]